MRDAVFRSWIKGGTQVRRKRHVRIQARFYVFLVLLALIALMLLLWVNQWNRLGTTAIVTQASLGSQYQGQIVIVRDETLYDAEGVTRVDYVAEEGSHLYKGGVICRVYSSGYNQTEINKLENYRSAIQQYHKEQVMQNYVDAQLDRLNSQIDALALEIRTLVQGQGVGSLNNLETQMTSALNSRQNYLRQKYPQDLTLSSLYQQESQQLKKIESWTTTYDAQEECIVSFYTDGYESTVNAETYEELTLSRCVPCSPGSSWRRTSSHADVRLCSVRSSRAYGTHCSSALSATGTRSWINPIRCSWKALTNPSMQR